MESINCTTDAQFFSQQLAFAFTFRVVVTRGRSELFRELEMAPALSFPIIDMGRLAGEERPAAMDMLRDACEKWGFFQVRRHNKLPKPILM